MIAILGFVLATMMLWDAFEVIILPRRVTHRFRFSKFFYRSTWQLRSVIAEWITGDKRRESYLSIFGPTEARLRELRRMYEPNVQALSDYLFVSLPQWFRISETPDSWQIRSWQTPIVSIATENSGIQDERQTVC
jgi:hypothetical protein